MKKNSKVCAAPAARPAAGGATECAAAPDLVLTHHDIALVERWRALAEAMVRLGGEFAWGGRELLACLAGIPAEQLRAKRETLAALAAFCIGRSERQISVEIAEKLARYESTRWRREQALLAPPLAAGAEYAALFRAMRACGDAGAPKKTTIRNELAESRRLANVKPLSVGQHVASNRANQTR